MNIPTPPDNPAGRWRDALVFCVNAVSSSVLSVCVCPTLGQTDTQTKSSRDKQRQQHKHIAMCLLLPLFLAWGYTLPTQDNSKKKRKYRKRAGFRNVRPLLYTSSRS